MASSARIDELKKKFDENPRRYFAPLANEYRKSGDPQQAIVLCQEYLPQQPGHMSGHIVYGQALFELSRFDESRGVFEAALFLDPENLIALRHLGEIARQAGDSKGARVWYQRVLEADPHNEEIAAIMVDLLAAPAVGRASGSTAPAPPQAARGATVTPKSRPTPTPAESVFMIDESEERTAFPQALPHEPASPPADDDSLDGEDFSVGGVPLSSLGAPPPSIEPLTPPANATSNMLGAEDGEFDGEFEAEFEADPFAVAASAESVSAVEPPINLASDIDLGLRDDGQSTTTFSEQGGERLADFETFGEALKGSEAAGTSESAPLEVDTFFAAMTGISRETEPLVERAPAVPSVESRRVESHSPSPETKPAGQSLTPAAQKPGTSSKEFVTETMAELYLEQGHPEAAIAIYHRLAVQRPNDRQLTDRLHQLEAMLRGGLFVDAASGPQTIAGTPTIREFLVGLLNATPVSSPPAASVEAPPATPSVPTPARSVALVEARAAQAQPDVQSLDIAFAHHDEPSATAARRPSETVSGSIDALFSRTGSSTADVDAATTLSRAFANDAQPLTGVPAHAAKSEPSLDDLFKKPPSRRQEDAEPDRFSFDRFFADEWNDAAKKARSEPPATHGKGGGPGDVIDQFKNWLNGLKKP